MQEFRTLFFALAIGVGIALAALAYFLSTWVWNWDTLTGLLFTGGLEVVYIIAISLHWRQLQQDR